jgi:hypothetical protein
MNFQSWLIWNRGTDFSQKGPWKDWNPCNWVLGRVSQRSRSTATKFRWGGSTVAEPRELFRLKCASHRYTADTNSTHFKRNNSLVCRVSARCNHGSTGSKQVYLALRRVYSRTTTHQFLIHRILNIITNHFKFKVINKHCLKRQAKHACQVHSRRKLTRDYTRREGWHHTQPEAWCHSGGSLLAEDGSHSTDQPNGAEVGHAEPSVGFSKVIPEK